MSLDVGVRTSSGFVRNAYQDKGRSVENILAMGLRFISVSRTSNRRLIVMDEADNNVRNTFLHLQNYGPVVQANWHAGNLYQSPPLPVALRVMLALLALSESMVGLCQE